MSRLPSVWTEPVWRAICDLSQESGKGTAKREDIWIRTGAPVESLVDEAIKRLIEDRCCVIRIKPGVFMPVQPAEEEAFSITTLEDSSVKLEKGDVIMRFGPRGWARFLATVTAPHKVVIEYVNKPGATKSKPLSVTCDTND